MYIHVNTRIVYVYTYKCMFVIYKYKFVHTYTNICKKYLIEDGLPRMYLGMYMYKYASSHL